ncbi:MAG TPA: hypothetical protein VFN38_05025 [Gemmatimonadaceae bacterium]|nr:hypothetical protein [Gemmatimonadaceae bacterium]
MIGHLAMGAWLAALAALADAAHAGAQRPAVAAGVAATADTTLDPSVVREIEMARARGVPTEPLLAKVREGRLKRAPVPRIRTAVRALATRLDSARAALGPDASADELIAGADALAAGADVTAVRAVRDASPAAPVSAPLGALAQLVASGVPPARAVTMIVDLMRRKATPSQVLAFGNSVEADAAGGLPAEEAARFRWREFGSAAVGDLPARDALTSSPGTQQGSGTSSPSTRTPRRRP